MGPILGGGSRENIRLRTLPVGVLLLGSVLASYVVMFEQKFNSRQSRRGACGPEDPIKRDGGPSDVMVTRILGARQIMEDSLCAVSKPALTTLLPC